MSKEVFLHVGPHKTGTTSIQAYLLAHEEFLAEHDIFVMRDSHVPSLAPWLKAAAGPKRPERQVNCVNLAHCVIRPSLRTNYRLNVDRRIGRAEGKGDTESLSMACGLRDQLCDHWQVVLEEAHEVISRASASRVVISGECFSFLRTEDERQRLRLLTGEHAVRPILFFRDQEDWMRSWRAQLDKREHGVDADDRSESIFDFSPQSWLTDHDEMRGFWGDEASYLSYDGSLERAGSVLPDFLQTIGLDLAICPQWEGIWENRTPAGA